MPTKPPRRSKRALVFWGLVVLALGIVIGPQVSLAFQRAGMARAIGNTKQVKLALDSFAMDFGGAYPNRSTGRKLFSDPAYEPASSNDYLRQTFISGDTGSEKVFWYRRPGVTSRRAPDDITTDSGGNYSSAETLQPGDCVWAYVTEQKNTSNPSRPLILDPFTSGTTTFDHERWAGKGIVMRIDSSVRAERLDQTGRLLDAAGDNILSADASAWREGGIVPDIAQPDPK